MNTTADIRHFSRLAAAFALVLFAMASTQPAVAAGSQLCRLIEAQLAALDRSAGGQARRLDKAIRAQEAEIGKMRARASNAGCDGFLGGLRGQCGSLKSTISHMDSNLASLRRQRSGVAGDPRQERARLGAALDANGCRVVQREASLRRAPGVRENQPALFEQLFGGGIRHRERMDGGPAVPGDTLRGSGTAASGSYRTLCVRTCDGYFFPIAYSSSLQNFDRDAKACEAACPGTDVELFRHRVPGEEAEAAVSARSGRPYAELPNAFLYRKAGYSRPATCGCNPPKDFSIVAGGNYRPEEPAIAEAADHAATAAQVAPATQVHAASQTNPEEVAAAEIGQTPDLPGTPPAIAEEPITSSVETKKPAERRVRVVGPTFLPDPAAAIDLRAPGRKEVR